MINFLFYNNGKHNLGQHQLFRNIKIYCDGNAYSTNDIVSVTGSVNKIEPLTVSRPDDSDLVVTYEMKNATVSKITE